MKRIRITVPIMPDRVYWGKVDKPHDLDFKAICAFVATGFFLDQDSYWTDQKALRPGHTYILDENGCIKTETKYWDWHYAPREISLKQATEEFSNLFNRVVNELVEGKKIILPLSGGLDSRTLAAAMQNRHGQTHVVSWEFNNGHPETKYAEKIAKVLGFPFSKFIVPRGYLWSSTDHLAKVNGCYSKFTSSRPMALIDKFPRFGEIFLLGHLGDLLFDNYKLKNKISLEEEVAIALKAIVKKGGIKLATDLWNW